MKKRLRFGKNAYLTCWVQTMLCVTTPGCRASISPTPKPAEGFEAQDRLRETKALVNNGEALSCKYSPNAPSSWESDLQNEMEISACQDLGRLGEKEWVRQKKASEKKKKKLKSKSPEVPGKMRKHGPTKFHYGQVIYFYHPL